MKSTVQNATWGEIVYSESFWTGKKEIFINGTQLKKINKNTFSYENGETQETVMLSGNFFKGTTIGIGGELITMCPHAKWYEIMLAILPFITIIIWGNVPALFAIIPVVGGAIGGMISAGLGFLSMMMMKSLKNAWQKVLVGLAMFAATFLVCFVVAIGIVAALT